MVNSNSTKRKKVTTINFALSSQPASHASAQTTAASATSTANILREKTTIRQDGTSRQRRSMVSVVTAEHPKARDNLQIHPVVPIYEPFSTGDHGGEDYDDEDGGRDLRDSDDPLRQWAEDHRTTFLAEMLRHEGRGECTGAAMPPCIVSAHRQLPFHTIQRWTGSSFERRTLKDMGLRIQLGHWHDLDRVCPLPQPAAGNDFVIIDSHGVHSVNLDFCNCGRGGAPTVQLLRARLWPATTTNPRTAATFAVLRRHHLLSLESKCAALEFYQSLARESDNVHYKKNKDRYHEFLRITREWRNVQMLKRAGRGHDPGGISATKPGECALLCPACPHPGINLPAGWRDVPNEKRFLCIVGREGSGARERLGVLLREVKAYMSHVRLHWKDKQEKSHCVAHDAVDKPDREARGTASSGIGAVDCARHNMKRPKAVGDLQLGERYINMDYMFFHSIVGTDLVRFFVSYDIACQWHLNIWTRMVNYADVTLTLRGKTFLTFLVPKFHLPAHIEACNLKYSFNLTPFVGQTDGEAPERGWADANPLARSTKEMGPGFRRDTLDDHFNDWNHKKIIGLGQMLRRKVEKAVPEMVKTQRALNDMNESLGRQSAEVVAKWTEMALTWEDDVDAPNPFETLRKDKHVAHVRAELAAETAAREAAGQEDDDTLRGDMHITELIAMGLQLEEQQRVLGSDIAATGLHPTDGQRRAMTERTSKLRRKIVAWIDIQHKFFPALANVRAREDDRRARVAADGQSVPGVPVSDVALWLPSAVLEAPGKVKAEVAVRSATYLHEYRLRIAQAAEALHDVRRLLLVRTHLYKMKDTHARGVRANMRSSDKIAALNDQIKRAARTYRAAHKALVTLGHELNLSDWERTLLPLAEDDIRGLPQSHFHDPERKKEATKKRRKRARTAKKARELSWIWVSRGEEWNHGDDAAMNEAVRIEWAKTRARAMRWAEEVDLLEEEMRRVKEFLWWRSHWWTARVDGRQLPAGPQREGEAA
ncbi:hypothetical protein C8R45DRAFT_1128122, partial [Mycena sanguinolenta]